MLAKDAIRLIVALMQGEDDIVIMVNEVVYDIAVIGRGHIAGSEDMGIIITVAEDDEEEGDDDEYTEDDEGEDDELDVDDADAISVDLAGRYIALGD